MRGRYPAQHGSEAGPCERQVDFAEISGACERQIDAAVNHAQSHYLTAAAIRRLCVLSLLLPLSDMSASSDSKLDVYPGEKPLASEALDWIRVNKPRLGADARALADGYQPRALLAYAAASVPVALVAGGDVTAGMVANREVVILAR